VFGAAARQGIVALWPVGPFSYNIMAADFTDIHSCFLILKNNLTKHSVFFCVFCEKNKNHLQA